MTTAAERLHLLYDVSRKLAECTEVDDLLRFATRRARELFEAEGCALLLVDAITREFYFPIASQSGSLQAAQARLAEIRFPADRGIAGWVLSNDRATIVDDARQDPRFYHAVDQATHMETRAVLCAPLRTPAGIVGVIEVVNPAAAALTGDDLQFLETLAADVAVAYEKARLYSQIRGEVTNLRQAATAVGIGLGALGLLTILGTALVHAAWALPWGELPTRPGLLAGVAALIGGCVLLGVGRGWLVGRPA